MTRLGVEENRMEYYRVWKNSMISACSNRRVNCSYYRKVDCETPNKIACSFGTNENAKNTNKNTNKKY